MRSVVQTLIEDHLLNPGIIDLVFWFPHLTWGELGVAALSVLGWGFVCERIWRAVRALLLRLAARAFGTRLRLVGTVLRVLARV
ncbi:MAG: hypothetical protein NW217_12805 [Hyphomicrobiaceae bacterium]|nr:hypothetical protein [Hyphomicrobiaceae bacterium]